MTLAREVRASADAARLPSVDGLRGVLAFVVFVAHGFCWLGAYTLLPAANLAVLVFFLLSGYVLTRGWDGRYCVFLIRRFLRLWPVYALCLGAGYAIEQAWPTWSQFFWYPLLNSNSKPAIDPPIWSLCVEAWAMPFMPLIVWAGTGLLLRPLVGFAAVYLVAQIHLKFLFGIFFLAGSVLARFEFRNRLLNRPVPQWLGRISYSLYLSHFPLFSLGNHLAGRAGVVAAFPLCLVVAWAIWRWIERPSVRLSRRVGQIEWAWRASPLAPTESSFAP